MNKTLHKALVYKGNSTSWKLNATLYLTGRYLMIENLLAFFSKEFFNNIWR